jgi:hypothetical protein
MPHFFSCLSYPDLLEGMLEYDVDHSISSPILSLARWTTDLSPGRESKLLLHDLYHIVQGPLSIAEELRNCLLVRIPIQRHVRSVMEITVDAVQET